MKNRIVLTVLWVVSTSPFSVMAEETERAPALQRCQEFCAKVFDRNGNEFEECALACGDADVCHRDCKEKFGEDHDKVHKCLRTCMRRTEKPPAAPPAEPVAPVEIPVKL